MQFYTIIQSPYKFLSAQVLQLVRSAIKRFLSIKNIININTIHLPQYRTRPYNFYCYKTTTVLYIRPTIYSIQSYALQQTVFVFENVHCEMKTENKRNNILYYVFYNNMSSIFDYLFGQFSCPAKTPNQRDTLTGLPLTMAESTFPDTS